MADKYLRLVCFVVNICSELLREFFIKLAKTDLGTSYTTVDAYLSRRHGDVTKLRMKRQIRNDQYDLMYPGHGTADVNQWDVTLLVTLITELFASKLQPVEKLYLNEIRGIRNQLQHLSNTSSISDADFDRCWDDLDKASMTLVSRLCNANYTHEIRKKIDNAKTSHLPDLGDALRLWYEEIIRQMSETISDMSDTIKDMKNKLDNVESSAMETTAVLRKVSVAKTGPTGDKHKRFKTVDGILTRLQVNFEKSLKELPDSFIPPSEENDIRTKLRDNHHVVVTGRFNSRYCETALAAIKKMDYNPKRCVEIQTSSDWRHIDPEEVDFLLCKDPFGSLSYEENKAKSMADIFKNMLSSTKGDGQKHLDILIVTDYQVLTECKTYHDHDLLEYVVKVFDDTSETQPADLTLGCTNQKMISTCLPVVNNAGVVTSNFLNEYNVYSSQVDKDVLKEAREKFKAKKVVVVTGPKHCGKTTVAVALASSYQPSQCILLTDPNDFKFIDFQNTCLVIIDEFAGKYRYEETDVYRWYTMFDHLYSAIVAGKMNVVITCERNKLKKCCSEILQHPILNNEVVMSERTVVIKQEMMHLNTENTYSNGAVTTGITMTTSRNENRGPLAIAPITARLPHQDTSQFSTVRMAAPMISMANLSNGRYFPSRLRGNNFPEQVVFPERRAGKNELLSSTYQHPEVPSVTHIQTKIPDQQLHVNKLTGPHVWSVKDGHEINIRETDDKSVCFISGSCILPSGEILLADFSNKRVKKLDDRYRVISVCDLPDNPCDVCYIGNNEAVVAHFSRKLQFVDIRGGMTLTRSVDTDHICNNLACHGNNLYVIDSRNVYMYSTDGALQRVLYNYDSSTFFDRIIVNDAGSMIYITDLNGRLITIDSAGNYQYTFTDSELFLARTFCIDGEGHVLIQCRDSKKILQLSSDGKQKLGIIENIARNILIVDTICFDRKNKALIVAGDSDHISVLKLH